jgi:hypothetical protein
MFPYISEELIKELQERFPHKSPHSHEAIEQLMFRGGQRSIVDFLITMQEEQLSKNKE